jgi:hypothetical protein
MPALRLPNPGSAFDPATGKLYLFGRSPTPGGPEGSILVLRCWPDPRAWQKSLFPGSKGQLETSNWRGIRPFLSLHEQQLGSEASTLPSNSLAARRQRNVALAQQRVPDDELAAVRRYSAGSHWRLLNLFARAPGFLERVEHQPGIAFLMAHAALFKDRLLTQPYRAARRLQGRRARDILAWLHWSSPRSALRLLSRCRWSCTHPMALISLRQLLVSGEKWVHHVPRLDSPVIGLLEDHRSVLTLSFLLEVADLQSHAERLSVVQRMWVMRDPFGDDGAPEPISPFGCMAQFEERWAAWQEAQMTAVLQGRDWPSDPPAPPPFAGDSDPQGLTVVPLDTWDAIAAHGHRMQNCLSFAPPHVPAVVAGRGALYAIADRTRRGSKPAMRASAYLEFRRPGSWQITELERPNNRRCSKAMWRRVEAWFDSREAEPGSEADAGEHDCGSDQEECGGFVQAVLPF